MRSKACLLVLATPLAFGAVSAHAQDAGTARIPTVSRLVLQFSRLEAEWTEAARRGDGQTLDRLVADDFEVRRGESPSVPIPRAEWLVAAPHAPVPAVSQMAVRALGDVAVVSFRAVTDAGGASFIVDVWVQRAGDWKIAARYESAGRR